MPRSSAALTILAALLLAGCRQAGEAETGAFPASSGVPLLQERSQAAPGRDDPPALRAELERREREAMALRRKAAKAPQNAAGGCVHASPTAYGPPQPKRWLPQPPRIRARLLGRQVEVDVELQGDPSSLACRPWLFSMVVSTGQGGTSTFNTIGGVSNFVLFGPGFRTAPRRFRVLGHIPFNSSPPYHLSVNTESPVGRSPYIEQTLACPPGGCLPGPTVQTHAITTPSPVLPLRGVTATALARSIDATFAFDQTDRRYEHVTCTASMCALPFTDRLRGARAVSRYRIQGERAPGCWLGTIQGTERTPPDAEVSAPETIGGCVSWR